MVWTMEIKSKSRGSINYQTNWLLFTIILRIRLTIKKTNVKKSVFSTRKKLFYRQPILEILLCY